jgi:hypothetical protein
MQFIGKILWKLWRAVVLFSWCLLGLWTALAAYFTVPAPTWLAVVLAIAIAGLYVSAWRERFYVRGRPGMPWREIRRSAAALAVTAMVAFWYFGFVLPNRHEEWIPQHEQMPVVTFEGDKVHVQNVRNFNWRTATDFTPAYYDRTYDLNALNSMYYVISPIFDLRAVAHVWVSFGFSDGQYVSISVEARGVKERPFGLFRSMFRQFQLIYVVGDERDIIGLRGAVWENEVRFYPVNATDEGKRAFFVDMLKRADALGKHPEFYHLIANNCMNNVTYHVCRQGGRPLPSDLMLVLTGFSDRAAYDYGFIDTAGLPFEKAREVFRVDEWMRDTPLDEGFSLRLRENLARQVNEATSQRE